MSNQFLGYFSDASQTKPEFDPVIEGTPCPVCLRPLARPVVTVSLMGVGSSKSYFFRAHKACWNETPDAEKERIEHSIIDGTTP